MMFQSDRRKDDSYRRAFGNGGLEVLETVIEPDAIYRESGIIYSP